MAPSCPERLKLFMLVALGTCLAVFSHPNSPRAQEVSSPDPECLACHEKVFDHLPPHVHKPFDERKCYQCHQFQFMYKAALDHSFTFQTLAFDRTYSFRLTRWRPLNSVEAGNQSHVSSAHVSSIYSFSTKDIYKDIYIKAAVMKFSGSDGFDQIELTAHAKEPASAILTWKTNAPEHCMVECSEQQGSMEQAKSAWPAGSRPHHAENSILSEGIGIKACYQCHPKEKLGVSHPVGILPSQKVREKMKTADLPTGKNGLLLCITCHFPHASSKSYLGRKAVSEELCLACHPKEIYNPK